MLSDILAEVQKNSPIGRKRPSLTTTPKLEPMVRKKRRKTMINLPNIEKTEQMTSVDDISLRYITNGIMDKKTIQNKKDEIDEKIEEKENKSHVILER